MPVPPEVLDVPDVPGAFGIGTATVTPLRGGLSGAVWRVEADERQYVLRRHDLADPGQTIARIASELAWLDALGEQSTVRVPVPVRRADGALAPVAEVAPTGMIGVAWTLVHWVEGATLGRLPDTGEAARTGAMLAGVHQHALRWESPHGFERPSYDVRYFARMATDLFARTDGQIDRSVKADLRAALPVSLDALGRLMGDDTEVGLIHADVHDGNVVFDARDGTPGLIDFARFGVGCWALDLAMAMHYLTEDLSIPLAEAYTATFDLSAAGRRALPALRYLAAIENLAILSAIPDEAAFVLAELPDLAARARSLAG